MRTLGLSLVLAVSFAALTSGCAASTAEPARSAAWLEPAPSAPALTMLPSETTVALHGEPGAGRVR
jgi:hypothetical protein